MLLAEMTNSATTFVTLGDITDPPSRLIVSILIRIILNKFLTFDDLIHLLQHLFQFIKTHLFHQLARGMVEHFCVYSLHFRWRLGVQLRHHEPRHELVNVGLVRNLEVVEAVNPLFLDLSFLWRLRLPIYVKSPLTYDQTNTRIPFIKIHIIYVVPHKSLLHM
jgi:hypothetical protein